MSYVFWSRIFNFLGCYFDVFMPSDYIVSLRFHLLKPSERYQL